MLVRYNSKGRLGSTGRADVLCGFQITGLGEALPALAVALSYGVSAGSSVPHAGVSVSLGNKASHKQLDSQAL